MSVRFLEVTDQYKSRVLVNIDHIRNVETDYKGRSEIVFSETHAIKVLTPFQELERLIRLAAMSATGGIFYG